MRKDDAFDTDTEAPGEDYADAPVRVREKRDPLARLLGVGILITVIGVLAGVVYVLYAGMLAPQAPRTVVERQVMLLERYTQEDPTSVLAWADYLRALTLSGQHSRAQRVLDDIEELVSAEPVLMVEHGRLLIETGEPDEAMQVLQEAVTLANEQRDEKMAELAGQGVTTLAYDPYGVWIVDAALLQAGAHQEAERWQDVVDAATVALDENATMGDVLTIRGWAYVELGSDESAEADFRAALTLLPDYEDALAGLDAIGATEGE